MVLVVPLLGGRSPAGAAAVGIGLAMLKAVGVIIATIVIARFVVPKILYWVDASRSREVSLLAILALCIGTAWLTALAGLSLALGAFLGGMVVADTEYGHRAMGDILPLRDAFVSVFFVSLGMLFDVRVVDDATLQPLLAAVIGSMFLTPLLLRAAPHITAGERLLAPLERLIGVRDVAEEHDAHATTADHVVIVGCGVAGRFAAPSLQACEVPFVVLELNADNVRAGKRDGFPITYADATSAEALGHAGLDRARLVVLLMNDPLAAQRIVDTIKRVAPEVPMLMRARYLLERPRLEKMGAADVVAEEVEGALEIITRMLRRMEIPRNLIDERLRDVRDATKSTDRTVKRGARMVGVAAVVRTTP